MAPPPISIQGFQAQTATNLMTAVNTYLATLVNPNIRGFWVDCISEQRTIGRTYRAVITTDNAGGVIGTPWTLQVFEADNAVDAAAAANAWEVANPNGFYSAVRITSWLQPSHYQQVPCAAFILTNATFGANANFVLT